MSCTSHHHACDCREQKIATLTMAALEAVVELDWIKNLSAVSPEGREKISSIVERVYAACEALGGEVTPCPHKVLNLRGMCVECWDGEPS